MAGDGTTRAVDRDGKPLDLVLYKADYCVFCRRVQRVVDELAIPLRYRDTWEEPQARQDLIALGGMSQVPCLVIDGRPLYESADIIRFLREEVRVSG